MDLIISSISEALLWSVLAIGVYLMYKILDIADLSVEGIFPLGAASCCVALVSGINPIVATIIGFVAGSLAGLVAGLISTKLKIPALLTGILVMTGLYSVNLRIMQKPNVSLLSTNTIYDLLNNIIPEKYQVLVIGVIILVIIILILLWFYNTEIGLAFIATGDNEIMAQANGINTDHMKIIGYMIANGLVGLSGALLAQYNGFSDVQSGIGTIVIGLAAVIIGGVIVKNAKFLSRLILVVVGACIYRLIISFVLQMHIEATDLKLISAVILTIFLALPSLKLKRNTREV
ncbi:ABC transporter permease [Mycoplasma sp. P36-A1]|uniref:ABC transporter permease n=1 Tax=Mycoplasma sp. P36-A1 TaxID=3252900 RepID=UPI003C304DD0